MDTSNCGKSPLRSSIDIYFWYLPNWSGKSIQLRRVRLGQHPTNKGERKVRDKSSTEWYTGTYLRKQDLSRDLRTPILMSGWGSRESTWSIKDEKSTFPKRSLRVLRLLGDSTTLSPDRVVRVSDTDDKCRFRSDGRFTIKPLSRVQQVENFQHLQDEVPLRTPSHLTVFGVTVIMSKFVSLIPGVSTGVDHGRWVIETLTPIISVSFRVLCCLVRSKVDIGTSFLGLRETTQSVMT